MKQIGNVWRQPTSSSSSCQFSLPLGRRPRLGRGGSDGEGDAVGEEGLMEATASLTSSCAIVLLAMFKVLGLSVVEMSIVMGLWLWEKKLMVQTESIVVGHSELLCYG